MTEYTFNTSPGQTVDREQLVAYLNVGTKTAPDWAPFGRRTTDSSEEYDWSKDDSKDILGKTNSTMKKPIITQSFDPLPLDAGEKAITKIWHLAIVEQNAAALCALDMLIVHTYADFAERYEGCAVEATGLGGEGGGNINMPISVTYGGTRTVGTAAKDSTGKMVFTPETEDEE